MNLYHKWIQHLKENDMTYLQHLIFAFFYGSCCLLAGLYLIIHSVLPCFFSTAGSDLVKRLNLIFKKINKRS
jgi:hypothetical protein